MSRSEVVNGTVEDITYHNEQNGFTIMVLSTADDEVLTVLGELLEPAYGEELECTGVYTTHPTYGRQFKATAIQRILPSGASAILRYLSGGAIKGIGPGIAARIVTKFGDDTLDVLENNPEFLAEIKGISSQKAMSIGEEYKRIFGLRSVMISLASYGINSSSAIAVWKRFGAMTKEIIDTNPYLLSDDELNISFESIDLIADRLGFKPEDRERVRGGICYVLRYNKNNGHCCLPMDKFLSSVSEFLNIDKQAVLDNIEDLIEDNDIVRYTSEGEEYIYLPELFDSECYIAGRILGMMKLSYSEKAVSDEEVEAIEKESSIGYAEEQKNALHQAVNHSLMILTGGPGTGKTTTLNGILKLFERRGMKVLLAAPTGRAAKRLAELTGKEAKTIHRLLEVDFTSEKLAFRRNQTNPLQVDAIIVDEMSMVDIKLFENLLSAVKLGSKLIMVGDPDQLPSVGPGNVLRDLIASEIVPTVNLNHIFRQAAQSSIVVAAHDIVSGEMPNLTKRDSDFFFLERGSNAGVIETVAELVARRLPKAYNLKPTEDIQIICPSRKTVIGTEGLNRQIQAILNPPSPQKKEVEKFGITYREGDKVMQIKNNYDIIWTQNDEEGMGIFNGDIGWIEMIDKPSKSIIIRFEDKTATYTFDMLTEIDLAYAITVHKSQGNEFEAVIIPITGTHSRLYYRNLLYTAVTRAKKLLVIVGQQASIHQMVSTTNKMKRYSNLKSILVSD